MELLVKKASLAFFLKEQYAHHERQVLDEIANNNDLQQSLEKASDVSTKLAALNEEIDTHPNVRQLREIIASASRRQPTLDEAISDLPPLTRSLFLIARVFSRALSDIFATIKQI
jgi:ABC-type transporter Mla subunit MlaD